MIGAPPLIAQNVDSPGFVATAFTPGAFAKFSLGLLYDQATVQTPAWGSGANGLEKRAEWRMAGLLSRSASEYAAGGFRGTETSYVRCRCKGFLPRSKHVLISEFTERRLDGSLAAPLARMSGIATGTLVTSLGRHESAGGAAGRAALLVNTDIGFNMLNEFWPEIKRTMLFRHK
jgi:hypothetical protein